jgi:hypothetical protein
MKTVFALFPQPTDADNAISKLKEAGLDTGKARIHTRKTIEDSVSVSPMAGSATGASAGSGTVATGGTTNAAGVGGAFLTDDSVQSYLDKIDVPGDQQQFYAHGIKEGGHLVHIQVPDSDADKVLSLLKEVGGRAPNVE